MFVLIWATLLFFIRGIAAEADASVGLTTRCVKGFCITLSEAEITAEAGLCVVIPCSFSTTSGFTPQHLVWHKCEPLKSRCRDSEIVFHTYKNNNKIQSRFMGRISLLEPEVIQNCSIIINDLTVSDSGSYRLRVNGVLDGKISGYTFFSKAAVSVKGLIQKPTVVIPPLAEGQQTTLSCTAPGLCSGSDPKITWTWRGAGEKDSHITGNLTAFKTEHLTAVTQRLSSTLTFNSSAEHHGTNVTCKVSFTNNITAEETLTLNVTYVKELKMNGIKSVKEGDTLNLTCSVESFPPSLIVWTKSSDKNMQNGTETNLQNGTETFLKEESGLAILSISNVTKEDSGLYICTAKYLNNTLMGKVVDVKVVYMRNIVITGNTAVEVGDALNLTCSVESFPPSHITWTNTHLYNGPATDLQSDTGSATLVIPNVKTEYSARYICTAQHLNTTVTTYAEVTVILFSKILKNSGCVVQSEVLNCVCITEGFPLPTITWPLLKKHTEYSVITSVSNHTVNSTVILPAKDLSNTSVECVSSNGNGEAKQTFTILRSNTSEQAGKFNEILNIVSRLEVIIAFLIGILLSAVICCVATQCLRKNKKNSVKLDETLEMVTSEEDPLVLCMDAAQAVEEDQTYQEAADGGGAVAAERAATDLDGGPKDVEYASINFSMLTRKSQREAAKKQETTETEYAEIKKEVKEERDDNGGEEGCVLEGKEEEGGATLCS
ncbi:myelin-associated glycoprotein-like [Cottoperca gobio]|uniref:Myelin-associated glycoprotein-like n=1 Tax=Cottoperca gobio TaxID=56716 RepID=A0A6J2RAC4_COTGO|nr:myelin-associated glycoprotein-like [Cottoperca gobio]